ncbi:MAG TPA: hypothetical protein VFN59_07195 [Acidimicrobiales bacterium]|nr:hypothetical protein [Acidimicrobiales bacterium]
MRARRLDTLTLLDLVAVVAVAYVALWALHPALLVSSTLLTGGDTGSHLALPAYLAHFANPLTVTPWYPGWLDGLPAYTYYFVLPDVLTAWASHVIGFAVAFKLSTVLGTVLTPLGAYLMGRLFGAPRPVPAALAMATLPFLFDATYTIDGGNLFSTMAGEYPFSLSLALALVTIGLVARGVRTGRGYWASAILLSLTLAGHVLPWFFALGASTIVVLYELLYRRGVGGRRRVGVARAHPALAAAGLALFALWPLCLDAHAWVAAGPVFSTRGGLDSRLVTVALAAACVGLIARGRALGGPRGYWLGLVALAATGLSVVVDLRWALALLALVGALALVTSPDPEEGRTRLLARGDYARPLRFALGAGVLSFGLSAWWLLPFGTTQRYTDSLGYVNVSVANLHAIFTTLGWFNPDGSPAGDRWVIALAGAGVVLAVVVRDRLGLVLAATTVASFWVFVLDPQSAIWNQRLIPFWFIAIHLLAGWLVAWPIARWWVRAPATRSTSLAGGSAPGATGVEPEPEGGPGARRRARRATSAVVVVVLLGLASTLPGQVTAWANALGLSTSGNQVTNWAQWNYSGYQAKSGWPEYHALMTTMAAVGRRYGCGRALWEYSAAEDRFGTPEALMLLPYWTNDCIDSEEGLLMESSPTTPYHYLDQAELSVAPSDPQVGLNYGPPDVARGVAHLQRLGVRYYMAYSPSLVAAANRDPALRLVATTRAFPAPGAKWYVYRVRHAGLVEGLAHPPAVVAHVGSAASWLAANQTWWLTPRLESVYLAASGPASWPRARSVWSMPATSREPSERVSRVRVGLQSVSFRVSRLGVPTLVKVSYYPGWHVTGATGPYRVSPNLMVVVPTSHRVELLYGSTPATTIGRDLTLVTVIGGLGWLVAGPRRRRRARR